MQPHMNIGRTIKVLRTAAGLNQREFAARLGISASYLSLIESDQREPSISFLKSVSRALGVPISVMFIEYDATPTDLHGFHAEHREAIHDLLMEVMQQMLSNPKRFENSQEAANGR